MTEAEEKEQLADLLGRPQFLIFLSRLIQTAGIYAGTTNGADGRNLVSEGRRNLGLDLLRDVARGQAVTDPEAAFSLTLIQVLREAAQATPQEKPNGRRRNRYDSDDDGDGGSPAG